MEYAWLFIFPFLAALFSVVSNVLTLVIGCFATRVFARKFAAFNFGLTLLCIVFVLLVPIISIFGNGVKALENTYEQYSVLFCIVIFILSKLFHVTARKDLGRSK
jgi:hypothetical protein